MTHCSKELKQLKYCSHATFNANYHRKSKPVTRQELLQLMGKTVATLHGYISPEKGQNISFGTLKMCCSPLVLSGAGSLLSKSYIPMKQQHLLPTELFHLALTPLSGVLKRRNYGLGVKLELHSISVPWWPMTFEQKDLVSISEK